MKSKVSLAGSVCSAKNRQAHSVAPLIPTLSEVYFYNESNDDVSGCSVVGDVFMHLLVGGEKTNRSWRFM